MKRHLFALTWAIFLWLPIAAKAQNLSLNECLELSRQNYPLIRQKDLITRSRDYTIANAHSGYLPQFTIAGQATYQSDVTRVPIDVPGISIKPLSKDQYKIYAEVNQTLYDGGNIRRTSDLQNTSAQVEDQRVEIELYSLRERIHQLYFGILLLSQQISLNDLLSKNIQTSLAQAEAARENGTALKLNVQILKAELLKVKQHDIESKAARRAYLDMLGVFIDRELGDGVSLEDYATPPPLMVSELNRPELQLFNLQRRLVSNQYLLSNTRNTPRVGAFLQGGYGRPGLNALKNEYSTYYIGGLRLSWNISGFYNTRRDKQLLEVNTKQIDIQQSLFEFNTRMVLKQQSSEMNKLEELIRVDDEIIALRSSITETSRAQLSNGVISAHDFLRELNAEDQAKQSRVLHDVQLRLARVNYLTTTGTR